MSLPDLQSYGFTLLGGRMLATPDGAAAMLMYQDDDGSRISFYVRPSTSFDDARGSRSDDGLALRYWYRNGYGFGVVGRADAQGTPAVQQALPASGWFARAGKGFQRRAGLPQKPRGGCQTVHPPP